jgi:hypothetical protein
LADSLNPSTVGRAGFGSRSGRIVVVVVLGQAALHGAEQMLSLVG